MKYEGPSSLAVRVATLLADAEGIELTSAERQEDPVSAGETIVLALTVEATTEEVMAAVGLIRDGLPDGADITLEDQ